MHRRSYKWLSCNVLKLKHYLLIYLTNKFTRRKFSLTNHFEGIKEAFLCFETSPLNLITHRMCLALLPSSNLSLTNLDCLDDWFTPQFLKSPPLKATSISIIRNVYHFVSHLKLLRLFFFLCFTRRIYLRVWNLLILFLIFLWTNLLSWLLNIFWQRICLIEILISLQLLLHEIKVIIK